MNFGWFEVGSAEIWIDSELQYIDGEAHYSVQCIIQTASWVKIFTRLNAHYESLINVETLKPLVSRRNLKYGKSIDIRTDKFFYKDSVRIHAYIEDLNAHRYHSFKQKDVPILDFLSTYLSLRNDDLSETDEPVQVRTWYSNTLYEFQMIPDKYSQYKLKNRRVNSREFKLQFPKNDMFKNGKHGKVIISNDKDKIPLKIDINIILGSFYLELEDAK